jgi:hypothetical protein
LVVCVERRCWCVDCDCAGGRRHIHRCRLSTAESELWFHCAGEGQSGCDNARCCRLQTIVAVPMLSQFAGWLQSQTLILIPLPTLCIAVAALHDSNSKKLYSIYHFFLRFFEFFFERELEPADAAADREDFESAEAAENTLAAAVVIEVAVASISSAAVAVVRLYRTPNPKPVLDCLMVAITGNNRPCSSRPRPVPFHPIRISI